MNQEVVGWNAWEGNNDVKVQKQCRGLQTDVSTLNGIFNKKPELPSAVRSFATHFCTSTSTSTADVVQFSWYGAFSIKLKTILITGQIYVHSDNYRLCSTQRVHIYSVVERVDGHLSLSGGQKHFSKPSPHPFPETVEP